MTPKFNIRLATQTDIKCITDLYLSILRETPINILMYSDVSDTDYRKYREEKLSLMIRDGATKVIIAADEETEEILGVLTCFFIGMEKKGFKRDPALPPPTLPPGTNFNRLGKYIAKLREWKQDVLTVFGPHISELHLRLLVFFSDPHNRLYPSGGDTLHVSQKGRRAGIGTALCKEVAKDAKLFKVPVFFDVSSTVKFTPSYAVLIPS